MSAQEGRGGFGGAMAGESRMGPGSLGAAAGGGGGCMKAGTGAEGGGALMKAVTGAGAGGA